MNSLRIPILLLLLTAFSTPLFADRELKKEAAEKLEVRHSMIGFRDTLLFYTFEKEKVILVISIGNKDETFPVTGKVHLFAKATTKEDLDKWINNQHSDGLFPDIPTPVLTQELPRETGKVTSSKETGKSENSGPFPGSFKNFEVEFKIQDYEVKDQFKLSGFSDTSKVHVKIK